MAVYGLKALGLDAAQCAMQALRFIPSVVANPILSTKAIRCIYGPEAIALAYRVHVLLSPNANDHSLTFGDIIGRTNNLRLELGRALSKLPELVNRQGLGPIAIGDFEFARDEGRYVFLAGFNLGGHYVALEQPFLINNLSI